VRDEGQRTRAEPRKLLLLRSDVVSTASVSTGRRQRPTTAPNKAARQESKCGFPTTERPSSDAIFLSADQGHEPASFKAVEDLLPVVRACARPMADQGRPVSGRRVGDESDVFNWASTIFYRAAMASTAATQHLHVGHSRGDGPCGRICASQCCLGVHLREGRVQHVVAVWRAVHPPRDSRPRRDI
jgi:hypothetical protein